MISRIVTGALPVLGIAWILDLPGRLGAVVITEQYLAVVLGLAVLAGLIARPLPGAWRWPDLALGLAAMGGWLWLAWNYEDWLLTAHLRGPEKWLPAVFAIAGMLEATRRHCGMVLAVLGAVFMAYGFWGWLAPGLFEGAYLKPARYLLYVYSDSNGVPGLVLNVAANQIMGFILFGVVLTAVGGSDAMTRLALSLMGHRRGGPAKVAILASSLFGTLSGSTVANVMSTGVVTIPMMKKAGFPARHAAAIEAVASNGGQIAPPVMGPRPSSSPSSCRWATARSSSPPSCRPCSTITCSIARWIATPSPMASRANRARPCHACGRRCPEPGRCWRPWAC